MQCRPLTGFAYGFEPPSERNQVSVQPIRRPGLLRHEEAAVAPDVDQDLVHVRDPALRERLDQARLAAQRLVALVPLVGREVRLDALERLPAEHGVVASETTAR